PRGRGAPRGRTGLSDERRYDVEGDRVDQEDLGRPPGLGEMLRSARESRGLSLADVAELTHVRQEYLRALEDGRYADLPEDVYARSFVSRVTQAAGRAAERALSTDQSERRQAGGLSTHETRLEQERRGERPPAPRRRKRAADREGTNLNLGTWIP